MKNGKRLTVAQKKFLRSKGLNPEDWLVTKNTPERMELVHRYSDRTRKIIQKGGADW